MKNQYEATYILDIPSKEETVNEVIESFRKEIEALGGHLAGTQKMDRKRFERVAGRLDSAYYLTVNFELEGRPLRELQTNLARDKRLYRQFYLLRNQQKPSESETPKAVGAGA